jgi:dipeptidyl aminopeptidase/acylaminoacyl peptidase
VTATLPILPYGRWPSPVSADVVATASTTYDATMMCGDAVYWIEGRPDRGRRNTLVRWTEESGSADVLPDHLGVGSDIYGYGGGAYTVAGRTIWFSAEEDQRIYRVETGRPPVPLTAEMQGNGSVCYGDLRAMPDRKRLICVREQRRRGTTRSDLVAVPAAGGVPVVLATGWDFYAGPEPGPDGSRIAWLSWRDPLMPWDGTWLWVAELHEQGIGQPVLVAGGPNESVIQPRWGPDGELHFVSDRSGWWNLYHWHRGHVEAVASVPAEMAVAPWELGYSTYVFLDEERIATLLQNGGRTRLGMLNRTSGELTMIELPYTSIKPYLSGDGHRLALIGSSPRQTPTVALVDPMGGAVQELAGGEKHIDARYISVPQAFTYTTRDGDEARGLYYPPTNPDVMAPSDQAPPLIVRPHPGPTSNAPLRLEPTVQFFTSRGFAVADVDYRGSTGYGRAYRTRLNGHWGVLDVVDCVDAAAHLADQKRADPDHVVISGASAGGYTALRALAITDRFAAGCVRSAIIDPAAWREAVPAFQHHHADTLIGPWPADAEKYNERSVLFNARHIEAPVLVLHGGGDSVAPAEQAQHLADALTQHGVPCTLWIFPDAGHTFRAREHLRKALMAELDLYTDTLIVALGQ